MSRGRFEVLCRGLSPIEQDKLADQVCLYPEEIFDWQVDAGRVAVDYQRLVHTGQLTDMHAASVGARWANWAAGGGWSKKAGKTAAAAELALAANPPTSPGWFTVDAAAEAVECGDEPTRRYFLNDVVDAAPPPGPEALDMLHQLAGVYSRLGAGMARQVWAGEDAVDAIAAVFPESTTKDAAARAALSGITILLDPGMAPNAWKLIDPVTGTVHFEGVIGPTLDDYARVVRDCLDDTTGDTEPPRYLI